MKPLVGLTYFKNMQIQGTGALASQHIEQLIQSSVIQSQHAIESDQIQPASLDLRLGSVAYRVRSSFLPGKDKTVKQCLNEQVMHKIDLSDGAVLEKSCVYIIPLMESLHLPERLSAAANPKSSTGRIDVFTRLITDYATEFEQVASAYQGKLYAEVAPLTFSIQARQGSRLSQLRIRSGGSQLNDEGHIQLQEQHQLIDRYVEHNEIKRGVPVSVGLTSNNEQEVIGYRAKRHCGIVDVDKCSALKLLDYWEPLYQQSGQLILDPGEFYILVSKEAVHVPANYAAEMVAYDTLVGEFRVHYAGFFDPGFGAPEVGGKGAKAVLEVRSFDVPFLLEDGQNVGRLVYEKMLETPNSLYGANSQNNYQAQSLKLSKHFIMR